VVWCSAIFITPPCQYAALRCHAAAADAALMLITDIRRCLRHIDIYAMIR